MVEIVNNILWTFQNLFEVLQNDLSKINQDNFLSVVIPSLIGFAMFYFPSRWFKAYLIRLFLFVVGIYFFWNTCKRSSVLFGLDFYASIGIFLPHIAIVELTYLIIKERTLFLVDKVTELFLLILSPFIWLYHQLQKIYYFIASKLDLMKEYRAEKQYQKQQQKEEEQRAKKEKQFYQDEFKREQERAYKEEQAKYDEADKKRQGKKQQYRYKKKEKKQQQSNDEDKYQEDNQQQEEEQKTYSRWDSSNPYEVLGIDEDTTASEIKKAYRNLSKIYHPDLTLFDKEENTIIFQKINGAYEKLKNK